MIAFLHPALLGFLAALGLPVLIHFLTRPRPRRIALPTLALLQASSGGLQARDRLRTILILLLRILALAALVLAFTRPSWLPEDTPRGAADLRAVVLVDASLSMSATGGGLALFERATAQAADLLRDLPAGSECGVVLMRAQPRTLLPTLSRNRAALHEGLRAAVVSHEQGDAAAALALADQLLGGQGRVYVFSDCQRSNWAAIDLSAHPGLQVILRAVSTEPLANCGFVSLRCEPAQAVAGERVRVIARVLNAGARREQRAVRFAACGQSAMQNLELPPYSSAEVAWTLRAGNPGSAPVQVTMPVDALAADDERHAVLQIAEATDVLLLSDAMATDEPTAATFFSEALRAAGSEAGLRLQRGDGIALAGERLRTAEVLVLVPPLRFAGDVLPAVAEAVAAGLDAVVVLTPAAAPLLRDLAGTGTGVWQPPCTLIDAAAEPRSLRPPARYEGPLRVLTELDAASLGMITARQSWRTGPATEPAAALLHYSDGSLALARSQVAAGRILWWNLPADTQGGDFVGHPLFPVLLHECLRSLRQQQSAPSLAIGPTQRLSLPVVVPADAALYRGAAAPTPVGPVVIAASSGALTELQLPPIDRAGAYELRAGARVLRRLAVNTDARESDTRRIDPHSLLVGAGHAPVHLASDHAALLATGRARPWWPMLVSLALSALVLEMLLLAVWRRRTTAAGRPPA